MADITSNDTYQKVALIISEVLKVSQDSIATSTFEQLGMDSLDAFEIIMRLEESFKVEISDELAVKFTTLNQVVDAIHTLQKKTV